MIRKVNNSKAEAWRDRFSRFSATSTTVQKFCDGERVSLPSFYYWRRRLAGSGKPAPAKTKQPVFQAVSVTPPPDELVVRFPGDIRLTIPSANPEAIRAVVTELARIHRAPNSNDQLC